MNIIIIDDSDFIVSNLVNFFIKKYDAHVESAKTCASAALKLHNNKYDYILLDFDADENDNTATFLPIAKYLKDNQPDAVIILISSAPSHREKMRKIIGRQCFEWEKCRPIKELPDIISTEVKK